MQATYFTLALTLLVSAIASPARAEGSSTTEVAASTGDHEKQALNLCALAVPLMNAYVLNYEYLVDGHHGLAARLELAPTLDTAAVDGTELALVLNYRYHFSPKMQSAFVGAYARARYVYGEGSVDGMSFDFDAPEVNVGLNFGYRWIISHGINVVIAAGYGYSWQVKNVSDSRQAARDAFAAYVDNNGEFVDAPFYGEFSVGYAF